MALWVYDWEDLFGNVDLLSYLCRMNCKRIHDNIINRARLRDLESYSEKHHVIPRCLGGDDSPENIVRLTAKEHYLIHRLLVRIHPENYKLICAYWYMCNSTKRNGYKPSTKAYESAKIEMSLAKSKDMKGKKPSNYDKLREDWKRPVLEFLNNEFVQEFDSIKAAADFHGVDRRYIFNVVAGKSKKPRLFPGYSWAYKNEEA